MYWGVRVDFPEHDAWEPNRPDRIQNDSPKVSIGSQIWRLPTVAQPVLESAADPAPLSVGRGASLRNVRLVKLSS